MPKDLDNGGTTAATSFSDEITPRPPIVIDEDNAYHLGEHPKETHFDTSNINTIKVQKRHNVNNDELLEDCPRLEDYLIPHHQVHIDRPDGRDAPVEETCAKRNCGAQDITEKESEIKKECCTIGIIHKEVTDSELPVQAKAKRKVQFSTVLVRDYDMILGDHPCCSHGPPITIDWDYLEYEPLDVNEYEFHHPPRKSIGDMCLDYYQRKKVLSHAGFTEVEFKLSEKEVRRAQLNRNITRQVLAHYPILKIATAVESICRKCKRFHKEDHWKQQKHLYTK